MEGLIIYNILIGYIYLIIYIYNECKIVKRIEAEGGIITARDCGEQTAISLSQMFHSYQADKSKMNKSLQNCAYS